MTKQPAPGNARPRILLAEDEAHLAKGISYNLDKRGNDVVVAPRGDTALELASSEAFDLIILDVMMPGLDGFEVCARLRERRILTPVLMLTARHELENRIKGIRLGADDYLGKPFNLDELFARIEALLRRRRWDESDDRAAQTVFKLGPDVEFDANLLKLKGGDGRETSLTAIEARLLALLLADAGRTLARAQILKKVWGFHEVGGSSDWIESVRGVGYRFNSPN
ncbi:MAG: response regulator transcription factor [Deltaproteobacteria bacterium]|nr:response regulator transcription factor [Deltaproteobacteria bacterium]